MVSISREGIYGKQDDGYKAGRAFGMNLKIIFDPGGQGFVLFYKFYIQCVFWLQMRILNRVMILGVVWLWKMSFSSIT